MFRDYSKLGEKIFIESNCKYLLNVKSDSICLKLPNGGMVLLKSANEFTRKITCPRYSPKSKWMHIPDRWEEISPEEAFKLLNQF